ncbi:hypothetical protein L3X38_026621 [Prunus dulcis]|uniref:Uncharacterized protein n=1 Tax=Prunus dulcis TaxID=3755 RepID=A0AAD4VLC2_PRUDU|nr:hypothetical protein L3X38_026621 [Prunus dulcis]
MHGSIHGGIGNLVSLSVLAMDYNYFSGSVPNEIGKLQKLQDCRLWAVEKALKMEVGLLGSMMDEEPERSWTDGAQGPQSNSTMPSPARARGGSHESRQAYRQVQSELLPGQNDTILTL